jgi:hypothetical protein
MALPALRVDMFIRNTRPTISVSPQGNAATSGTNFALKAKKHGIEATAVLQSGDFIVQAGSLARLRWEGREAASVGYDQLHAELLRTGILKPDGERCVFTQNYAFKSPSAAAAVVLGRNANGTLDWRLTDGSTYKEWEAAQLGVTALPA